MSRTSSRNGVSSAGRLHQAALCEVAGEFLVEDVGQLVEEAEFFASGDRTHGQVIQVHSRGAPVKGACPIRGQTRSAPREETSAVIMGIMGIMGLSLPSMSCPRLAGVQP